jgi:hydrogenase nickel incorporation protein HypA/HybF
MHELPVISKIMNICLQHAQKNNVKRIVAIELQVGALSDLQPEWMQRYFDHVSKNTIAKNAQLRIERVPVVMKCDGCGHSFDLDIEEMKEIQCPRCDQKQCSLISGKEYLIKHMEVI